ncbi:MAG: DUF5318 family protein [Candidatus Nanopelagicales bacterium]
MASGRGTPSIKGTKTPGLPGKPKRERPELREPESVANPYAPRRIVDHTLTRRAALGSLVMAATGASDHLDPHPHLLRAAKNHGLEAGMPCPWCKEEESLKHLNYVYGDELGAYSGRLKTESELHEMATQHGEFRVYIVEVCIDCGWNHLVKSYVLGDGVPRPALATPRDIIE